MYYNTTNIEGEELNGEISNTVNQENRILFFFRNNPDYSFAPHMIRERVLPDSPITSVRRAITNLTSYGYLTKTEDKVIGEHGKPVYTWKLRKEDFDYVNK